MQILSAPTEASILTELTYLSDDADVGTTSITVNNTQGFVENDYIVIGRLGSETAEIRKVAATPVSNTDITIEATKFAHKNGIQVQKILYNQRKFYRATSETGPWGTTIATKDIEVDRPDGTFYEDTTGKSTHWYKATYFNSCPPTSETSLDDAIATKAAESEHYTSLTEIRRQAGFEEAFGIREEVIADYRDEAEDEFDSAIVSIYILPLSPKPKLARQIINLLAAGTLLIKEYGMEADIEISKSGQRMIDRAYELIGKIVDGTLKLLDADGNILSTRSSALQASTSNEYDTAEDKGEMFNIGDERFAFKDPSKPTS